MEEIKPIYNRLLIFDGSHALHRSLCQMELWEMRNKEGQRTGGVYGVLNTILKESSTYNYFPIVVFDGKLSERRLKIHPNYKHFQERQMLLESEQMLTEEQLLEQEHRREYNTQREILKRLLPAFGIPVLHFDKWEGDDIIYILSKLSKDSIVVSDDKDLIQLVCDTPERRCRVRRGMRDEFIDINYFKENNMTRQEFVAYKAIVGDTSDNIPSSCFQVGEKTAPGLYKLYTESMVRIGGFPKTEEELASRCKELNLSKRKAYLNFDEEQFLTNILMMDLNLVDDDIDNQLLEDIQNQISKQYNIVDGDTIRQILNNLDIKSFIINNLIINVNNTSSFIDINTDVSSEPEIIRQKTGTLF